SARAPLPHAEHRFLGQGMACLAGEHGDLSAMVSVVGDEITDEPGDIGPKTSDLSVALERAADDDTERMPTVLESPQRLRRGHRCAIELFRNFFRLCRFQPHYADIVHMRDDRGNRSAL